MDSLVVSPPDPYTAVLDDLGRRQASGMKLSSTEENMAMVAAGIEGGKQYGPSIRDSKPLNIDVLPETVKGVLASHAI